jgi:hypothetical protein
MFHIPLTTSSNFLITKILYLFPKISKNLQFDIARSAVKSKKMSIESITGIKKLTGDNFDGWKFQVETYLSAEGLQDCLYHYYNDSGRFECMADYMEKDNRAKHILMSLIGDECLNLVRGKKSALDMWESLNLKYS